MPSLYCHYISGTSTLERLSSSATKSIVDRHRNVFNLGTQGPDIFFYYDVWPLKRASVLKKLGGRLHCKKVHTFFQKSLEYISQKSGAERDILLAYMLGYICHYSLDSATHPYVFYRSGLEVSNSDSKEKYDSDHRKFETALDVLILDHTLSLHPRDLNPFRLVNTDKNAKALIGKLYAWVLEEIYNLQSPPSEIANAIRATEIIQRLSIDRTGLKKSILETVESILQKHYVFSSAIHPEAVKDGVDYLNLEKAVWHMPWDIGISSDATFLELFEQSISDSTLLCELFCSAVSESKVPSLSKSLWNRSFYTGVDCDLPLKFRYFNSVYETGNS